MFITIQFTNLLSCHPTGLATEIAAARGSEATHLRQGEQSDHAECDAVGARTSEYAAEHDEWQQQQQWRQWRPRRCGCTQWQWQQHSQWQCAQWQQCHAHLQWNDHINRAGE